MEPTKQPQTAIKQKFVNSTLFNFLKTLRFSKFNNLVSDPAEEKFDEMSFPSSLHEDFQLSQLFCCRNFSKFLILFMSPNQDWHLTLSVSKNSSK